MPADKHKPAKPLLTAGRPPHAEDPGVGPDPTVCYATDTFYSVDGRLLRFCCSRPDGHDGPHEQADGDVIFRWAHGPADAA